MKAVLGTSKKSYLVNWEENIQVAMSCTFRNFFPTHITVTAPAGRTAPAVFDSPVPMRSQELTYPSEQVPQQQVQQTPWERTAQRGGGSH